MCQYAENFVILQMGSRKKIGMRMESSSFTDMDGEGPRMDKEIAESRGG